MVIGLHVMENVCYRSEYHRMPIFGTFLNFFESLYSEQVFKVILCCSARAPAMQEILFEKVVWEKDVKLLR